jgi:hypothetical protein
MPQRNVRRHLIPTEGDPANIAVIVRDAMYSVNDIIPVDSATERDQVYAELRGGDFDGAIYVDRSDTSNIERRPSLDEGDGPWEVIAGRQHGATVKFGSSSTTQITPNVVHALYFHLWERASPGWTRTGNYDIIIPSEGMYGVSMMVDFAAAAATLGRVFVELIEDATYTRMRFAGTNEDKIGGTTLLPLSKGSRLKVQVYQQKAPATSASLTMNIAQMNAPRW